MLGQLHPVRAREITDLPEELVNRLEGGPGVEADCEYLFELRAAGTAARAVAGTAPRQATAGTPPHTSHFTRAPSDGVRQADGVRRSAVEHWRGVPGVSVGARGVRLGAQVGGA